MQFVAMDLPVATEPVKLIASTSGDCTSASPTTDPAPMTRLATPGGRPASCRIFISSQALPGTSSAGLKMTQLPKARAGAVFHAGIAIGKFHGVTRPTTPTGSRVTSTAKPGRSDGRISPPTRRASPAKNLKTCPARVTSPTASANVLPSSRASRRPSSCLRARRLVPDWSRTSNRCWGVVCDHFGNACRAAPIRRAPAARQRGRIHRSRHRCRMG
ncbi:hypothetical protein OKW38_001387 [Paraburkholderia sp. MM5496-R1]